MGLLRDRSEELRAAGVEPYAISRDSPWSHIAWKQALDSSVKYLAWDLGEKNIRVNAISAGPVRTLAARSIAGFPTMEAIVEERAPLHRQIDAADVGAAAAYLLSDAAKNVTATTLYVDAGFHSMGM